MMDKRDSATRMDRFINTVRKFHRTAVDMLEDDAYHTVDHELEDFSIQR